MAYLIALITYLYFSGAVMTFCLVMKGNIPDKTTIRVAIAAAVLWPFIPLAVIFTGD